MTSFNPTGSAKAAPWFGFTSVALLSCAVLFVLGVVGVTGYFRLSSDALALRQSLMDEVSGSWHAYWLNRQIIGSPLFGLTSARWDPTNLVGATGAQILSAPWPCGPLAVGLRKQRA
jgi:hypothetical protein